MPYVASIGTYLPCRGAQHHQQAGDHEDAITVAVDVSRASVSGAGAVEQVIVVSHSLPLLESSSVARIGLAHNIGGCTAVSAVKLRGGPGSDGG